MVVGKQQIPPLSPREEREVPFVIISIGRHHRFFQPPHIGGTDPPEIVPDESFGAVGIAYFVDASVVVKKIQHFFPRRNDRVEQMFPPRISWFLGSELVVRDTLGMKVEQETRVKSMGLALRPHATDTEIFVIVFRMRGEGSSR